MKPKLKCLPGLITGIPEQLSTFHAVLMAGWPDALQRGPCPDFPSGGPKDVRMILLLRSISLSGAEARLVQRQFPAFSWLTSGKMYSASNEYSMSMLRLHTSRI